MIVQGCKVLFVPLSVCKHVLLKGGVLGRPLVVKEEINIRGFIFINVYEPNAVRERGLLFGCLRQELSQETLVVGGDWNCTMDFMKDNNGEEPHSGSVVVLRDIINQFDLVDVWRTRHPDSRQYTWVKGFGAKGECSPA
jgi:exonuclease III